MVFLKFTVLNDFVFLVCAEFNLQMQQNSD